jgi:hypothetical protein
MVNALSRLPNHTKPVRVSNKKFDVYFTTLVVIECVYSPIKGSDAKKTYNIPKAVFSPKD